MKLIFTSVFFALILTATQAQTASAVVFAELGEKFTLYLNGEAQNDVAKSNVKLSGLTGEFYQARIDFEDATLADFANNNFMVKPGFEVTYMIKKNKKGEYVLRFQSEAPQSGASVAQESEPTDNTDIKRISVVDKEPAQTQSQTETKGVTTTTTAPATTVTTTTTTTTSGSTPGENVKIGMNVDGINVGINMSVTGTGMETTETIETTETTKTTQSTEIRESKSTQNSQPDVVTVASKCSSPMSKTSFDTAKNSINSKGFDETKLSTAKQVVKSNCMTSAQIKEVMSLFGFDESRLDFAKYAYDYCVDTNNYYVVSEAFAFDSSADELNQYIESK